MYTVVTLGATPSGSVRPLRVLPIYSSSVCWLYLILEGTTQIRDAFLTEHMYCSFSEPQCALTMGQTLQTISYPASLPLRVSRADRERARQSVFRWELRFIYRLTLTRAGIIYEGLVLAS